MNSMDDEINKDDENLLLYKFAKIYALLCIAGLILAVVLAMLLVSNVATDSALSKMAIAFISSWLFTRVFTALASALAQFIVYRGNWQKHAEDMNFLASLTKPLAEQPNTEQPNTEPVEKYKTVIMHVENLPETPLGKYMDTDFYEWIDFRDETGKIQRFSFDGTIDMNSSESMPPIHGVYIVPPGIIYKKDESRA